MCLDVADKMIAANFVSVLNVLYGGLTGSARSGQDRTEGQECIKLRVWQCMV